MRECWTETYAGSVHAMHASLVSQNEVYMQAKTYRNQIYCRKKY